VRNLGLGLYPIWLTKSTSSETFSSLQQSDAHCCFAKGFVAPFWTAPRRAHTSALGSTIRMTIAPRPTGNSSAIHHDQNRVRRPWERPIPPGPSRLSWESMLVRFFFNWELHQNVGVDIRIEQESLNGHSGRLYGKDPNDPNANLDRKRSARRSSLFRPPHDFSLLGIAFFRVVASSVASPTAKEALYYHIYQL